MQKWHEMHPHWQYLLWDEESIDRFGLRNAAAFKAADNYGEKSDIARYEILERMGWVSQITYLRCVIVHNCFDLFDLFDSFFLSFFPRQSIHLRSAWLHALSCLLSVGRGVSKRRLPRY